ncbi:response regulator [Chondromyces crocatus]|uniref:Chemotaxis protein CheY n=1 Tax=Chondromyces crocatus TaxID=52 RepID=A0A0K1EA43_CHOCO|nr:response regulator [Chondromyces crocatus]AKT37453.1 chemotaxis protein CheY [Chondromyces crocatus]
MTGKQAKKVLVIEDDQDLVALVSLLLQGDGYSVEIAGNGREALDALARELPDVILLDMKMPVMNGPEFARELEVRYGHQAPIIVLTAAADAHRRAAEVGADAWLGKPFDPDVLLSTVRRYAG